MKKILITLSGAIFMLLGWFVCISSMKGDSVEEQIQYYRGVIEEQKALDGQGKVIECMEKIVELDTSADNRLELAEIYLEYGQANEFKQLLEDIIAEYPSDERAYEKLVNYYYRLMNFEDCLKITQSAMNQGIRTEYIIEKYYECAYKYSILSVAFESAGDFEEGFGVVSSGGKYGYVNSSMKNPIGYFDDADAFCGGVAAVCSEEGYRYIDTLGQPYLGIEEKMEKAYSYSEGVAVVAKKEDHKYYYLSPVGKVKFGGYEYASGFRNGVAAVYDGKAWKLINAGGEQIGSDTYKKVLIDESGFCSRKGVVFVSDNDKDFYMIDTKGKRISEDTFEKAECFYGDYAAVAKGGKWGFVDTNGKQVIDYKYEEARSFSDGIAAVKIDGSWGFITASERVVIELQFEDAKHFIDKIAPVKKNNMWVYIQLP